MNLKFVFLAVCLLSLLVALLAGGAVITGIAKAMVGVFFILFYLTVLFGGTNGEGSGAHH